MEENLGCPLLVASLFAKRKENFAIVSNNQYSAQRTYEFLLNFFSEDEVVFFPSDELLRAESLASSRELLSQRLYAMGKLVSEGPHILVTHPSALLRFLPEKKRFIEECRQIHVGDEIDLKAIKSQLVEMGYESVNKIEHSLQFASRGDILDIYSVNYLSPIRIEFFGDEVESIRLFDVSTQESKSTLKECLVLPATDIFLNDDETTNFAIKLKKQIDLDSERLGPSLGEKERESCMADLEYFISKNYKQNLYKYFGFALGKSNSIISYFDPEVIYVVNGDQFKESTTNLNFEAHSYLGEYHEEGLACSGLEQYMSPAEAFGSRKVVVSRPFSASADTQIFNVHKIAIVGRNMASIVPTIQSYLRQNDHVVLALSEPQQRKTIISLLNDASIPFEEVKNLAIPKEKLGICTVSLSEGFEIPALKLAYLSSNELFGKRSVSSRFTTRFKEATILKSYEDLKPGDYVVHEYNGIGQFIDVTTILDEGIHRDFLQIAYAGGEFLYVPLEQFRLVRKYSGREGAAPKLSRLSGSDWKKRKEGIKKKIDDLADRLIALYGTRAKEGGFAFPKDDEFQRQFEEEFPYELTRDQKEALVDIKRDMESPEAMDRLVCGDVGFGKTEVAFCAAFKAISAGKQVAMLAPTTLLARQHYDVAIGRFATFGVKIALFSRMVSPAEQKEAIEKLKNGQIDLAIGTHRLLSKEIAFKDLGLLIVDEEQRFGVEQKERIKEMKNQVDVLTLSATPIPRTLQMSLAGIRPISEINSPPQDRMPIETHVVPFKESIADELIQRELSRGGQVFYLHNRVDSIFAVASKMARRIQDVLICTSIVENGIDVPNANMIIVENASIFGLSQLYQIKGRVGRGNRIAYAYLMYPQGKNMNENARKRLSAIQEFTELGSGYKIAQRDLMIRGAGDILGSEQAGFIDSIGLDLYLKLLDEAVASKKSGILPPEVKPNRLFRLDAYIPKQYASKSDKIQLYQELEEIKTMEQLGSFQKKMKDIYGKLPEEVVLLITKKRIDILAEKEEFESLEEYDDRVVISLSDHFSRIDGIGNDLFNLVVPYLSFIRAGFSGKKLSITVKKVNDDWINDLEKVMKAVDKAYINRTKAN